VEAHSTIEIKIMFPKVQLVLFVIKNISKKRSKIEIVGICQILQVSYKGTFDPLGAS